MRQKVLCGSRACSPHLPHLFGPKRVKPLLTGEPSPGKPKIPEARQSSSATCLATVYARVLVTEEFI